jgi:hypothetical protein
MHRVSSLQSAFVLDLNSRWNSYLYQCLQVLWEGSLAGKSTYTPKEGLKRKGTKSAANAAGNKPSLDEALLQLVQEQEKRENRQSDSFISFHNYKQASVNTRLLELSNHTQPALARLLSAICETSIEWIGARVEITTCPSRLPWVGQRGYLIGTTQNTWQIVWESQVHGNTLTSQVSEQSAKDASRVDADQEVVQPRDLKVCMVPKRNAVLTVLWSGEPQQPGKASLSLAIALDGNQL